MSLDFSKARYVGEYKEDNAAAEVPAIDFSQAKYVGEYKEEEAPRLPDRTPQYDEYGTDITPERKPKRLEEIGVDINKGVGPMRADAYRTNYASIANLPDGTQRKIAESNSALAPVAQRVQSDDPLSSQIQTTPEGVSAKAAFRAKNGPVDTPQPEWTLGDAYSDNFWQLAVGANNIVGSPFSAVAPDSAPAQYFKRSADMLRNNYSPALQHKDLAAKKKIDAAREKDGEWGGFTSSLKEYGTDPALSGMIMFETLPSMLGVIGPMRAAQVYSAARGLSPAAAASLASTTGGISNAVMNGGAARQEAYDTLLDVYTKSGMQPDEAKEAALKDSLLTLTVGAGMGFLGGKFGGEAAVMGLGGAGNAIGRGGLMAATKAGAGAGLREVASEQGEEVLPQVVTNSLASEHDGRSPFDGVGEIAAKTLVGTGPLAGVGAASEAGRAYDSIGTALQDFADVVEGTELMSDPGQVAADRFSPAWAQMTSRAPYQSPEQVLTDIINGSPFALPDPGAPMQEAPAYAAASSEAPAATATAAAPPLSVEADAPVSPMGEADAVEAGQLDQQTLLDQIERQVFGDNGEQDGRQDQVSGDSRGDDDAGSGATVGGMPAVPLAGEGTAGTGTAADVAGADVGVPSQPDAALTLPAITVTPRKDGTAVVSGEGAQEVVAEIVPKASMVQRADGSVLVGATYAPAVQQAIQSMQTSNQPTATSVLQQTPVSLPIPQEIQRRMEKRTDAELDVIEKTAKDPVTKSAAKKEKQNRVAPIMQRDDLVGAIMRITGGRGIDPGMALTLTGDKANQQPRLRGLFKKGGTADMSDLAELLRLEQGYDVRDGTHLEELIREQAAGNPVYSMERNEREAAANEERQYRDEINKRAAELGLKQARGKRTLAMVEADIARVEQEQNDMEAREERAAIQAESVFTEMYDKDMDEAAWMSWMSVTFNYTQEEIDYVQAVQADREDARAAAYASEDTKESAREDIGERQEDGAAQEGARGTAESAGKDFQLNAYTESELAAREAAEQARAEAEKAATAKADKEKQDRQFKQEVKRRSEAAADAFELGQDAMENVSGQGGLRFSKAQSDTETDRQFKETERAYGGREAYDQAKTNGKTKLNYRQWVQVRTPKFKEWFGDWEALRAQDRLDSMTPVKVRVPDEWRELSHTELRGKMAEALDRMVKQRTEINHPDLGEIRVGRTGANKSLGTARDPAKSLVAADIEALIPSSIYARTEPSRGGDGPDIDGYSTLLARVSVDDVTLIAAFTVRHQSDGRWYYNAVTLHDAQEKAQDSYGRPDQKATGSRFAPITGLDSFIRQPLRRVNADTVSKVTDPQTGEPMVVYHATNGDFNAFSESKRSDGFGYYFGLTEANAKKAAAGKGRIIAAFIKADKIAGSVKAPAADWLQMRFDGIGRRLAGDGFDAAYIKDEARGALVVRNPTQIKSATGNTGDFDGTNQDIRFSRAGQSIEAVKTAWRESGIDFTLMEKGDVVTISKIVVPEGGRETGIGTRAMEQLIAWADANSKHLALTPSPDFGGNKGRLTQFYKRFGFKENKGKNRVFSVSESMIRENPNGKTLYSFAGQQSQTADTHALATAQDRLNAGEDAPAQANAQPSTNAPTINESDLLPLMSKAMGSETLAKVLLDSGLVTGVHGEGALKRLAGKSGSVMESEQGQIQGATLPDGRIILNLDALTADNFAGVFKHEGFHSTIRELLGDATYQKLMDRLIKNFELARGNDWVGKAWLAIPSDTKAKHVPEEIAAYAIEQVTNGAKVPGFIKRWVGELLSALRTAIIRFAKTDSKLQAWAMNNLKPEDLARLAVAGLRAKARGAMQGQPQMREAVAYSKLFAKVDQIAKAFEQRITQAFIQGRADKPILVAENTPSSMQMLGWKDRNIVVNSKELEKIGNKAGFETNEKIASIVHDLRRPALMFWNTKTKSLNFMHKGSPNMVIGVAPEVSQGRGENAHLVLTAHFLNGDDVKSLQNKISRGELVLIYKGDEVQGISGLAEMKQPQFRRGLAEGLLPTRDAEAEAGFRILREADMIKWENEKWGDNPKFSRAQPPLPGAAQPQPARKPALPADTPARKTQRKIQDKLNRFTVIKEWLAENGVTLSEQADIHKAEERMHSRFANKAQDFREKRVMPLVQKVQKAGFAMEDVAQFLHANHAQARNAQIAKINPSLPDGGSGMTNAEAQAILKAAPAELKALALEFRAITEDSKQILLKAGVIDQDTVNAWEAAYGDTYVPLKGGPDENAAKIGNGKGLSLKHKQKRALGHETRAEGEWIIENILADHERALMAAEKNRVFHNLVKMALETAHLDLITINKPEKRQVLMNRTSYVVRKKGVDVASFQTDREARAFIQHDATVTGSSRGDYTTEKSNDPSVAMMASPMPGPDEATGYINGHLVRVQFNDPLMAEAYNNMGAEAMNAVFRAGRALNGFFSKVYTGYNPEFIFTNILRDFTTGLANVTGEEGIAMAAKSAKNYAGRLLELAKYAATGNETKWVKMYREDGGNTGAAYLSDLERLGTDLQTEYAAYQGVMKNLAEGNYLTAARAAGRKTVGKLLNVIEVINMAGENAMRLAVYQSMVESGKSRAEAASMAKNVTVNFNRKGTMGAHANAAFLFFNAGVQGTASMAHAHFKGKHKYQAWAFSSSLAGIGYLLSLMAAADDEDDYEKTSEFDRSRNMLIKTENGYVKIPIPYGYGFFWNLGRGLADAQRTGEIGKMPWHVAASFVEEFTPFGAVVAGREPDGAQAFHGALPTALQIPHGILYNKTSFGTPMRPESGFDRNQPDRDKMNRPTRGTIADDLAGALESAGMDVSPETLKYLWRTFTGGAGTTATSVFDAAKLKAQGAELDAKEMPFVRKIYTETDVRGARARYYEAKDEADKALSAFDRARKARDFEKAGKIMEENKEMIALARMARATQRRIKAARDRIDSVRLSGKYTKAEERMIVKQMEKEEAEIYDRYLSQFKERTRK